MNENIFKCPECSKEFKRDAHYLAILKCQDFIQYVMNGKHVKNMCGSCKYHEFE
jgi:predicted nucleic-acid-binding Zn-ribbon protein